MSYPRLRAVCLTVAILIAALASYAGAQPPGLAPTQTTWINMARLSVNQGGCGSCHAPRPGPGHGASAPGSFTIKGYFNLAPGSVDPAAIDVNLLAAPLQWTFPQGFWSQVGKGTKYKANVNQVAAQIDYWVGGSSRCNFTFIGTQQDGLSGAFGNPTATVELQIGSVLDESLTVNVTQRGQMASMGAAGPDAVLALDSMTVTRNLKKANSDSAKIAARIWGVTDFDPSTQDMAIDLGSAHLVLPAGSILTAKNGKTAGYKGALPGGGKIALTINNVTSKVAITITKADLSGVTDHCAFGLDMVGTASGRWSYDLYLQENKTHTAFKY